MPFQWIGTIPTTPSPWAEFSTGIGTGFAEELAQRRAEELWKRKQQELFNQEQELLKQRVGGEKELAAYRQALPPTPLEQLQTQTQLWKATGGPMWPGLMKSYREITGEYPGGVEFEVQPGVGQPPGAPPGIGRSLLPGLPFVRGYGPPQAPPLGIPQLGAPPPSQPSETGLLPGWSSPSRVGAKWKPPTLPTWQQTAEQKLQEVFGPILLREQFEAPYKVETAKQEEAKIELQRAELGERIRHNVTSEGIELKKVYTTLATQRDTFTIEAHKQFWRTLDGIQRGLATGQLADPKAAVTAATGAWQELRDQLNPKNPDHRRLLLAANGRITNVWVDRLLALSNKTDAASVQEREDLLNLLSPLYAYQPGVAMSYDQWRTTLDVLQDRGYRLIELPPKEAKAYGYPRLWASPESRSGGLVDQVRKAYEGILQWLRGSNPQRNQSGGW